MWLSNWDFNKKRKRKAVNSTWNKSVRSSVVVLGIAAAKNRAWKSSVQKVSAHVKTKKTTLAQQKNKARTTTRITTRKMEQKGFYILFFNNNSNNNNIIIIIIFVICTPGYPWVSVWWWLVTNYTMQYKYHGKRQQKPAEASTKRGSVPRDMRATMHALVPFWIWP